jgi:hypothetical protein
MRLGQNADFIRPSGSRMMKMEEHSRGTDSGHGEDAHEHVVRSGHGAQRIYCFKMNRFLNLLIGLASFVSVIIVTGEISRSHQDEIAHFDALNLCAHFGLIVGAILFLQFAVERYLFPPDVFTKQRRKALMKSAETRLGNFFYGTLGVGYLFLFFYAFDLFLPLWHPLPFAGTNDQNWMAWSVFFLLLALIGRTRAVILELLGQEKTVQSPAGAQ